MIYLLNGILWRLGGAGAKPFGRYWRRIGWPLILMWACLWNHVSILNTLLACGSAFLVTTLPVTLFGDDIPGHWFNWLWLWILGALLGVPYFFISGWWNALPLAWSLCATLSNLESTKRIFTWGVCEVICGVAVVIR